jgi:DNA-binding beta-propeller fold protein YncE
MVGAALVGPLAGRSGSVNLRSALAGFFIIALVLMFGLFGGSAQAAPETIAEFGEGAGEVSTPLGAAVNRATGDLYIADINNFRIDRFDEEGEFSLAWGWGVRDGLETGLQTCGPEAVPPSSLCFKGFPNAGPGGMYPSGVAVDQASGAVYVADFILQRVTKFSSSGDFLFMVGRNVNETKVGEGGATQAEKNICTAASGDTCGSGETGTEPNEFDGNITAIAVDATGVVWVGLPDRLASFDAAGNPGAEIAMPGAGRTRSLAIDSSGNFYVISESLPGVRKLEAGTGALLETLDLGGEPRTVALDENDEVYVGDEANSYHFKVYNPAGEQISQFGVGEVIGAPGASNELGGNALAVDNSVGKLYAASSRSTEGESVVQAFPLPEPGPLPEKQHVENLLPTTVTLVAELNPEGEETSYHFEWGTSDSYGNSTPTKTLPSSGFDPEVVEADLKELIPGTTYHFRLVATSKCNPSEPSVDCTVAGPDTTFTTPPAVLIASQWATDITAHSGIVHAELDPLGVEAEVWLEYGTDDNYGQIVPLPNLAEALGLVHRQAFLDGLQAATTYHYRFVARDERDGDTYTVQGPDQTFTTQFGGLGFKLADNRVWEMVSPPDKNGAKLVGGGDFHLQASADGNSIAFHSKLSTDQNPGGNRISEPSMNLANRDGSGSWHVRDITTPNDRVTGVTANKGGEYKFFSPDLSEALLEPRSGTPLSEEASERTPYLRVNTEPPVYRPLITGKEPFANVPPDTKFGGEGATGVVTISGVSSDFRRIVLRSQVPLLEGSTVTFASYEWSNGQIEPVSVLPLGEGGELISGDIVGSPRGAVSADSSRVFWRAIGSSSPGLYVRDTDTEESARLDVKQPDASGSGEARPIFQGASADGSVVFFSDSRQLTVDAGPKETQLYRCELPPGGVASGCATLTNITAPAGAGERGEMEGIAPGVAEDAETIYFVARGVLDEAPNELGDSAVPGEPNLYVWQGDDVRYVVTLGEEDSPVWGKEDSDPFAHETRVAASVSPGGRYLTFMSQRSLTGYDNRDAITGEPVHELFRYDNLVERLECISCNATGTRPRGADPVVGGDSFVNPMDFWSGQRVAATLPVATSVELGGPSLYRPRTTLDNGRVFFNAIDGVVPADSNGQWDVYQYEPVGTGDCLASAGGASIVRSGEGCVSLISSGTGEEEAAFFDASETGDDAFFFTPARLSVFDEDNEVDIYDARVNGVVGIRPSIPECLGEACQPPPQAPNDPTPASAGFQGPGNVRQAARKKCPKGKRRVQRQGRVRCVPRKKRQRSHKGQESQQRHREAGGDRRVAR